MPLCRPDSTFATDLFWNRVDNDGHFVLQQHKFSGNPLWPFNTFRILIACNNHVIAVARNPDDIRNDWNLVKSILANSPIDNDQPASARSAHLLQLFFQNWGHHQMGNNPHKERRHTESRPPQQNNSAEKRNTQRSPATSQNPTERPNRSNSGSSGSKAEAPVKQSPATTQKHQPSETSSSSSSANTASPSPSNPRQQEHNAPSHKENSKETAQEKVYNSPSPQGSFGKPIPKNSDKDELSEMIPLELAPNDIKTNDFIGEGVYSEVYKGYCFGTQVAVKKFKNQGLDAEVLKGVRKEVRIMKSIRHPNLLLFLGACTIPGHLMIVTEIMDKSFHDIDKKKVDLVTRLKMAKAAAKGISWLHSLNPVIIHRDLKPENILIGPNNSVKVADFGLSLVKDHSKTEAEEMKKIRGSPAFMSPEALLGKELTPKTDVYSFGMILWELLTGGSPYDTLEIESFEELIDEICHKGTRERIPKDCPPSLRHLILSCWKAEPAARPNFLNIIQQLDEAIAEVAISDAEGKELWKRAFSQNSELVTEVPWTAFLQTISMRLHMSPNLKIFQGLRALLVKEGSGDVVTIEEFGNVLKWFGPMDAQSAENNFLVRMQHIFTKRWFHGDISVETAQTRLAGNEPGTFLIRFSSNPGSYALSKIIENNKKERAIVHIRIPHEPGSNFSFVLDDTVYEFDNLEDLVKAPVLGLTTACPGSYYYAQFRIKQIVSGYINTVNQ
eukprot:TRINITY_DN7184_c0_g1_i2.p1 TRINITY_DN7184_c0_g1~~TRINITY_DN7184_c0_g1_i2.p1  ORF type:complete len:727 (-),score=197.56 TRINITY_DN7184_c0_g1_i2:30-2210(-)